MDSVACLSRKPRSDHPPSKWGFEGFWQWRPGLLPHVHCHGAAKEEKHAFRAFAPSRDPTSFMFQQWVRKSFKGIRSPSYISYGRCACRRDCSDLPCLYGPSRWHSWARKPFDAFWLSSKVIYLGGNHYWWFCLFQHRQPEPSSTFSEFSAFW